MSDRRLVVETLCEHGHVRSHWETYPKCPGGSRRVVDLAELREAAAEAVRRLVSSVMLQPEWYADAVLRVVAERSSDA